jgi:hypothetical protein
VNPEQECRSPLAAGKESIYLPSLVDFPQRNSKTEIPFQGIDHYSGTFFNSSFFFWLCASVIPLEQCVVAEAGYNWYLRDIITCFLLKKYMISTSTTI